MAFFRSFYPVELYLLWSPPNYNFNLAPPSELASVCNLLWIILSFDCISWDTLSIGTILASFYLMDILSLPICFFSECSSSSSLYTDKLSDDLLFFKSNMISLGLRTLYILLVILWDAFWDTFAWLLLYNLDTKSSKSYSFFADASLTKS